MKIISIIFCSCLALISCQNSSSPIYHPLPFGADVKEVEFDFTQVPAGMPAPGWLITHNGFGKTGDWNVVHDSTARDHKYYFGQMSKKELGAHVHFAILDGVVFGDVELECDIKAVDGQEQQSGGLVWGFQDPQNYYACIVEPFQNRVRLLRVFNGTPQVLGSSGGKSVPRGSWKELKVEFDDGVIECEYRDKKLIHVHDHTFPKGEIGFCTLADAVVYFDDLEVKKK